MQRGGGGGLPLMEGNESLVIVPSVRAGKALEDAIAGFDNVVVMKAGGSIARIGELLDQYGRPRECATVLSCVGMKDEYIGPLDPEREYSYFTTVMIKERRGKEIWYHLSGRAREIRSF